MELRQIRSFLMLAAEGNFRRAAEKLYIVQPALSQQIQLLEEELGSELFVRTSKGVRLTTAGAVFKVEAERTVAHVERARDAVGKVARGQLGTVRIGFSASSAVAGRLALDLKRFHQAFPEVALELREMCAVEQASAIEDGRLDVGYARTHKSEHMFSLQADLLSEWTWVVAMASDHPLAAKEGIRLEDLQGEPFIVFGRSGDNAGQLVTLRHLLDREPTYMYQVNEALAVLSLVGAGVGIALAPEPMSHLSIPNLLFKPIEGYTATTNLALLSRAAEDQPAVRHYRSLAQQGAKGVENPEERER